MHKMLVREKDKSKCLSEQSRRKSLMQYNGCCSNKIDLRSPKRTSCIFFCLRRASRDTSTCLCVVGRPWADNGGVTERCAESVWLCEVAGVPACRRSSARWSLCRRSWQSCASSRSAALRSSTCGGSTCCTLCGPA